MLLVSDGKASADPFVHRNMFTAEVATMQVVHPREHLLGRHENRRWRPPPRPTQPAPQPHGRSRQVQWQPAGALQQGPPQRQRRRPAGSGVNPSQAARTTPLHRSR